MEAECTAIVTPALVYLMGNGKYYYLTLPVGVIKTYNNICDRNAYY